jgi:hypothetical protein
LTELLLPKIEIVFYFIDVLGYFLVFGLLDTETKKIPSKKKLDDHQRYNHQKK